jgi:hypothetical protein
MYLDESGDHSLDKIDPTYPVFVLGGVILDRAYARTVVAQRLRQLKEDFFDDPDLILHTADIVRAKNGFEALKDPALPSAFNEALNATMRELEYTVVACVIKKDAHLAKHGKYAADPYHYSLDLLVERFCKELGNAPDGGFICAEKRGVELDRALDEAWARLIREGTGFVSAKHIDERIVDLGLKDKRLNIAGLQLADLVVSPIARAVMGKPTREDWEIVKGKFRRAGRRYAGYGLVIRP